MSNYIGRPCTQCAQRASTVYNVCTKLSRNLHAIHTKVRQRKVSTLQSPLPIYPLRLQLNEAKTWCDSGEWELGVLGQRLLRKTDHLTVKTSSSCRTFMYTEAGTRPLLNDTQEFEIKSVETSNFVQRICQNSPMTDRSDSLYFTAPVADIGSLDKLPGWENLIVSDIPPDSTLGETLSAPTMSCWIGEPGVVTQAHYDVANNIFVQLHGQKEITFYHPNQAPNLYVFPDAHPRSRKSQVDFDQPNLLQFPGFASAEKWQTVILNPGDAVYIPSFWFHHVEALTTSVSVNCFSESILKFYAASIFNHKIDKLAAVRTHKNVKRKKELVVDFVAQLIAGLGLRKDFVQQLYHSRYSPLDISAAATKSESFCQRSQKEPVFAGIELNKRVLSQECNDAWNLELAPLYTIFDKIRGPDKQADKDTSYSSGVVEIVASHLVEFWVVRLFGSKNAGPVLRQLSEDEF